MISRMIDTVLMIAAFCIFYCLWHVAVDFLTSIGCHGWPFNVL